MTVQFADFVTIGLLVGLEGLLSADNALVMAVMVLGLPKRLQKKALSYGLVGAFAFRIVATLLAAYLMRLALVKMAGGCYLLYLTCSHFFGSRNAGARRTPAAAKAWLGMSAFWATVIRVELVNLAFSVDSILVAVAMSPKRWVVLTGGTLGIAAMRLVVGQLLALIERYPVLADSAFVIIAWVGIELLVSYAHAIGWVRFEVPEWLALGLIVVIFGVALLYARLSEAATPALITKQAEALLSDESQP